MEDLRYKMVECGRCHARYRCTPEDDIYETPLWPTPVCILCLIATSRVSR